MKFLRRIGAYCAALAAAFVATPAHAVVDLTALTGLQTDLESMTPVFTAIAVAFAITGWVVARII